MDLRGSQNDKVVLSSSASTDQSNFSSMLSLHYPIVRSGQREESVFQVYIDQSIQMYQNVPFCLRLFLRGVCIDERTIRFQPIMLYEKERFHFAFF